MTHAAVSDVPETLRVLVAMIAFQEDTEPRTSGKGSFDLSVSAKKVIDPSPHDHTYVQNHMMFAENYFRKVSNSKLILQTTVLDSVYRVQQQMAAYSPLRSSTTNLEVGRLMQDAWHLVDSLSPGVQFQDYNTFIIVHAGVGRDVDLSSQLGFDPTPFDIPSLYVNLAGLKKMYGASYNGIPVDGGSTLITHSLIIPETESREVNTGLGISLLQLGINGLIVASIGSHLGLPDLFDTKTGRTSIGRFGLMDGQSIFSWSGVFPPEPSAWEKYFLGWISPITAPPGEVVYDIPAVGLASEPDSVYKVLISAKEYFLVENRNRDANRDGTTFTIERDGAIIQRTYFRDTTNFNAFDQDSIYGNVIDVDEFDWSLPGGVNSRTSELFDGGILIWHIDENVIDATYSTNAVNANALRRGVDLEEGDGSQDLGQSYGFISPGSGSEDGTPLDFWYKGNTATPRVLSNAFTPNSNPNSLSNDFANSHVYIKDFSPRGPRMTAKIQVGDATVSPLPGFPKLVNKKFLYNSLAAAHPTSEPSQMFITTSNMPVSGEPTSGSSLYGWKSDGSTFDMLSSSGLIAQTTGSFVGTPVLGSIDPGYPTSITIAEELDATPGVSFWSLQDANNDSLGDLLFRIPSFQILTTSVVKDDTILAVGGVHSSISFLTETGNGLSAGVLSLSDTSATVGICLFDRNHNFIAVTANGLVGIVNPFVQPSDWTGKRQLSRPMASPPVSGWISTTMEKGIALASRDGYVYLLDFGLNPSAGFPVFTGGEILNAPALADIDQDGQRDIVVFSGNKIYAINSAGAILDNFPITVQTSKPILTSPVVADLDANSTPDIVAVTQEGLVVAYDRRGKLLKGFPILGGVNGGSTPAAIYLPEGGHGPFGEVGLAFASDDGHVYAWKIGSPEGNSPAAWVRLWPQYMYDGQNTGLSEIPLLPNSNPTFFPESRAYNWPNPVRASDNFITHIRYYIASDAKVNVKIFDMAGDLVAELNGNGIGGLDNEIDWNVANIQSGVYFAHIDAQGTGNSGSTVIKIAVVK